MDQSEFVSFKDEGLTAEFKRCGNQPEKIPLKPSARLRTDKAAASSLAFKTIAQYRGYRGKPNYPYSGTSSTSCQIRTHSTWPHPSNSRQSSTKKKRSSHLDSYGPAVCRYKGDVYDRTADVDIKITSDDQVAGLYTRKRNHYSERKVYRFLSKEDLRADLIDRVRKMALLRAPGHPWGEMTDEELLRSSSLYLRDRETGEEGYTLAAALLLGTDEAISDICPAYGTDAIVRKENLDRYDDRLITKTNLIESYDALFEFAQKNLPDRFHLEEGQSVSARDIIVREVVSNLLVHREYQSPYPAKLIIDKDRLRTENASRSLFEGRITLADFTPMPKNPVIANFFSQIGRADRLGSGMHNLVKYAKVYADGEPELVEGDVFRAYVPVRKKALAK